MAANCGNELTKPTADTLTQRLHQRPSILPKMIDTATMTEASVRKPAFKRADDLSGAGGASCVMALREMSPRPHDYACVSGAQRCRCADVPCAFPRHRFRGRDTSTNIGA